jgi:hypothetical protein
MRGTMLRRGLAALTLAAAAQAAAFALEFGLDAQAGNLQIPWTQQVPMTASTFPTDNYFYGGEAWLNASLGDDASIRVVYDRDPVLRNMLIATVEFERGIAKISAGPLFGFLNSDSSSFSAGLSASVRLQWPGVAYVSMRSDGGTAISIFQANADPQAQTELAAGFYVPNAIISGLVSAKRFNELDSSGELVTDTLTRYAMTIDVFKKNVPYTALFSLGYEQRSKSYAAAAATDSVGAIMLGVDATAQIDKGFTLKGGISTGAYVFGLDALQARSPSNSAFLFSANLGVSIDAAQLRTTPKVAAPSEAKPETASDAKAPEAAAPEAPPAEAASPAAQPEVPSPEPAPEKEKPAFSRLALDAGAGLYYNDRIKLVGTFAAIGDLFNARVGAWGSIGYRITPQLSIGGEAGIDYLTLNLSGTSLSFFDMPIRAEVRYALGKIGLTAFAGPFIDGITGTSGTPATAIDFDYGLRARLGGFYAEASYVLGLGSAGASIAGVGSVATDYPRFGLGYAITFN